MANKKFSDLPVLTALADGDIFATTASADSTSKKVLASKITDYVLSDTNIASKSATIITKLNGSNDAVSNGLKAQKLYYLNEHRDASYFLTYANLNGKPTIPTDTATFGTVAGFNNSGNFVSFDSTIVKMAVSGTGATAQTMTSDYVTEGTTNLFYTNTRVDARQELNFGNLFNTYSSSFDSGTVTESLQDVAGTFQAVSNEQSNIIRISDKTLEANFSAGQLLRVYGASATSSNISATPSIGGSIGLVGFSSGTTSGYKQFQYKAALFDLLTGEIGPSSAALSANVDLAGSTDDVLTKFNRDTFLSLTITGADATQGVLVYRQVGGSGGYKLVAVLGPKDLAATWKDYYTFDYTSWSGKNATDNSYSSITHFPLTAPSTAQRGWVDVTVDSIQTGGAHFDLNLGTTFVYVNSAPNVEIAHNDTNKINDAIVTKSSQGRKDVQLNAKTYNASNISVPSNFGLTGTSNITKIKKLPWSSYISSTPDNSLIRSDSPTNATSISLVGIDLDGNLTSQFLLLDSTDATANYFVDFGTNPSAILIDRCRIKNVIGGGVYATSPNEFKMTTSEIVNSGVTDRYTFSPLIADNGTTTIVTSNRFENYTDSVDVSVTSEGVIANNIVKSCGSGIFTYGSTFFLSSPNVLMGAANEFLPSPDILNSEYDSININRSQFGSTSPYSSDPFTYQENGADFNISRTSISSQAGQIVYRTNLIRKLSNGAEEIYGNEVGPGAKGINGFLFSTVTDDGFVDNNSESYRRYRITEVGDVNWTAIGAATATVGTSFEYNGVNVTGTSGKATPDEFVGYPNQNSGTTGTATKMIFIKDLASGMDRTKGQFSFEINDTSPTSDPAGSYSNLKSGIYSQGNLTTLYAAQLTAGNHPAGSQHVGVAWSASYRYYASAGEIAVAGTWNVSGGDRATNPEYTVRITPAALRVPLATGHVVRLDGHTSWTSGGTNPVEGVIININASNDVTIKYYGATNSGNTNGTATGTINIIDDFVMAQGLIK